MIKNVRTSCVFIVLGVVAFLGTWQKSYAGVSRTVEESAKITTTDDSCAELTKIKADVNESKREVTFSFEYSVWNDYKTPITQLHIMRGGRVITTFYNGVPPKSPGSSGKSTVKVAVPYGSEYEIKICMTLARTVDEGTASAEQGGGYSKVFAKITSD
jgi:hypothetical protein